ncbi:hypothetical protein V2J09_014336 [Rumex salicifolius]
MLLRTSSNPISPALLSHAITDSPTKRDLLANAATAAAYSATTSPTTTSSRRQITCSKSPLGSPKFNGKKGDFRRALSDSNLEDLASPGGMSSTLSSSCSSFTPQFQRSQDGPRNNGKKLESAPSFGIYHSGDEFDIEEILEEEKKKSKNVEEEIGLDRTLSIGELIESKDGEFSFGKTDMGLIVEEEGEGENEDEGFDPSASPPMYLATGLGADFIDNGGNLGISFEDDEDAEDYYTNMIEQFPSHPLLLRNYAEMLKASHVLAAWASFLWETATDSAESQYYAQSKEGANSGTYNKEGSSVEEHLRQLVEQNPSNAMFLGNYGQFLYETKGDLKGAEEYYSRAILADPGDGKILIQYANLVWEAHKDEGKARSYFERAAQAAPSDSHVLASYASFLWATEGDENEQEDETVLIPSVQMLIYLPQVAALRG